MNSTLEWVIFIANVFCCLMAIYFSSRTVKPAKLLQEWTDRHQSMLNRLSLLEIDVSEKFSAINAKLSGRMGGRGNKAQQPEELNKKVGGIILHGPPIRDIIESKRVD